MKSERCWPLTHSINQPVSYCVMIEGIYVHNKVQIIISLLRWTKLKGVASIQDLALLNVTLSAH